MVSTTILPGAKLGMLGSGQLGRMFAIAARRLGYGVHVFSPQANTPTGQVADREFQGDYNDEQAVAAFAQSVDVVSYEFENVPSSTVAAVEAQGVRVLPAGNLLHVSQNRIREKTFLRDHGFPVADFLEIASASDLETVGVQRLPGILKTAEFGYDGKGQAFVDSQDALNSAWRGFNCQSVLEEVVDFRLELSVVAVRSVSGENACYGPMENIHQRHILDISLCPARIPAEVADEAIKLATAVANALSVVGVLCVEMFLTNDGRLLINELAPRPHNSGHLTIDAHCTCQFEQQVRAICGLPLGSAALRQPAAMANLLGDLWCDEQKQATRTPDWAAFCKHNDVKLHLYGKQTAEYGRKMGHVTATADSVEQAWERVAAARSSLAPQQTGNQAIKQ